MAAGDRKFIGQPQPGELILQPGAKFTRRRYGFDDGRVSWLTHPDTPQSKWPQIGSTAFAGIVPDEYRFRLMVLNDLDSEEEESGLIRLDGTYQGLMAQTASATVMKQKLRPGGGISMFSLPAKDSGVKMKLVAPVPKPTLVREFLTTNTPTLQGLGLIITPVGFSFPALPDFSISFVPDPDEPQTHNLGVGWKMDAIEWDNAGDANLIYAVRETYSYYWELAV